MRTKANWAVIALGGALGLVATTRVAAAQTAEYASPDELPSDGLPHLLDVAMLGEYARVADQRKAGGCGTCSISRCAVGFIQGAR